MSQIVRDVLSTEITVLNNKETNLEQERDRLATLLGRAETQLADLRLRRAEVEKHIASMNAVSGSKLTKASAARS